MIVSTADRGTTLLRALTSTADEAPEGIVACLCRPQREESRRLRESSGPDVSKIGWLVDSEET